MKKAGTFVNQIRKLSPQDRDRIARSLKRHSADRTELENAIQRIECAVQYYWAVNQDEPTLRPAEVAKQLRLIADLTLDFPDERRQLAEALKQLSTDADEALELQWMTLFSKRSKRRRSEQFINLADLEDEIWFGATPDRLLMRRVNDLRTAARTAARGLRLGGRPRQDAEGELINLLALIYEEFTGRWPGRTVDAYAYRHCDRERHPYFEACLCAAGMTRIQARKKLALVRQVLTGRKIVTAHSTSKPA